MMDFELSLEEEQFREEVSKFFQSEPAAEGTRREWEVGGGFGPYSWELLRKLGERGWLTPHWPKQYGGLELPYIYHYLVMEEMDYYAGIYALVGTGMAGPVILSQGTEKQKNEYLPRIAKGEIEFCLGYTEPEAGSDLAALEMKAEDNGDYFLMNGQKIFNTRCHYAQYHWLGARTDTNVPKHRGISLFIVNLNTPGVTISPIWTFGGERTNYVFYDDVKVSRENLVGQKNRGFYYILEALNRERITPVGSIRRKLEQLIAYAKENSKSKDPLIRQKIAELAIEVEGARLLALRVAWMLNKGVTPTYEAGMLKMFASELEQRLINTAMQLLGLQGQLQRGSKWAMLNGNFEHDYRCSVMNLITRGTSEIMRNTIAQRGFGLPR